MKKAIFLLLIIAGGLAVIPGCSTDIDINGDKKEVAIIYGILDVTSKYQYIKINRAYLGEGNALEFAQIPDSTLFPYLLEVTLSTLNSSGNVVQTLTADTVHIYKESDIFYDGYQPYYRFEIPSYVQIFGKDTIWLNPDYTYRLTVTDVVKGLVYEAESPVIRNFTVSRPNPFGSISFATDNTNTVEWKSAENGKLYEVRFVFNYYEIFDSNPLDTILKQNDWNLGFTTSNLLTGNENMVLSYNNQDFFYLLQQRLEQRDDVERYPGYVDLVISVAADEMNTYIDVNQPSNSIIQEKPVFSNISNGIGLFSSKFIRRYSYMLNNNSRDSLRYGRYTKNLNFNDYFPNFPQP